MRYLIAHWCTARGQTFENPCEYLGPCSEHHSLDVPPEKCYKSEKQAQRYADKMNGSEAYRYGWRCRVVEVEV